MKNLLTTLLLGIILTSCRITTLDLKSDKFSYRENTNNEWAQFTDWKPIDIKVKLKKAPFKLGKGKLVIYDNPKLSLKLIEENEESKTEKGERIISYNCVDNDGSKCYLILIDKGQSVNAIIYYTNLNLCYNLIETK